MRAPCGLRRALPALAVALLALGAACGGGADGGEPATVTVFAGSSLKEAFTALEAPFAEANGGARVRFQFAGSDELATQIREGAPADVFAAASPRHPGELAAAGLLDTPVVFATNTLVGAVPRDSAVAAVEGLAAPGLALVVGAPAVPVGAYTATVLDRLDGVYGDGWSSRMRANVVSEEQSVKGIVAKLRGGDADGGFVYVTDVRAAGGALRALPVPRSAGPEVAYPIAAVVDGPAPGLAARFIELVRSPRGQQALAAAGFGPPGRA